MNFDIQYLTELQILSTNLQISRLPKLIIFHKILTILTSSLFGDILIFLFHIIHLLNTNRQLLVVQI